MYTNICLSFMSTCGICGTNIPYLNKQHCEQCLEIITLSRLESLEIVDLDPKHIVRKVKLSSFHKHGFI